MLLIFEGAEYNLQASQSNADIRLSEWDNEPGGLIRMAEFEEE